MKIVRFLLAGQVRYGSVDLAWDDDSLGTVVEYDGNPVTELASPTGVRHALADVRLLAPVEPSKVIGLARNYSPDCDPELPGPADRPQVFLKPPVSVIGPGDPIVIPALSHDTALEGELVVVIGQRARYVPVDDVDQVIGGYTVCNDVTARDFFVDNVPWGLAKGFDHFTPIGPWVVTDLTLAQASEAAIVTRVDGDIVQQGTTRRLLWPIAQQISYLSHVMTLLPGDVILTGTPAGACQIRPGQRIDVDVEGIGTLSNPVVAED